MSGVIRKCIYCNIEDDHPKHEQIHPGWVSVYAHMDCCALIAKCELCAPIMESAGDKRGEELRAHIMAGKG